MANQHTITYDTLEEAEAKAVEMWNTRTPTADVVEVVRCQDCIHSVFNWQHDELDETDYTDIVCDYFMTDGMWQNDFCSYGKRKGDKR